MDPLRVGEILDGLRLWPVDDFFQTQASSVVDRACCRRGSAGRGTPESTVFFGPIAFVPPWNRGEMRNDIRDAGAGPQRACRRAELKSGISVSVNISPTSLGRSGVAERIAAVTARPVGAQTDDTFPPMEFTETAAIGHTGVTLENLVRLRMRGFGMPSRRLGTASHQACSSFNSRVPANSRSPQFRDRLGRQSMSRAICETSVRWPAIGSAAWAKA